MRSWICQFVRRALFFGALVLGATTVLALPFTYQGRLVDGVVLANGNYELTFRLFDSETAGNQVGPVRVLTPVGVTNGLFTVELDFGVEAFDGTARWLELAARAVEDTEAADTLTPRQPITVVPYALRAFAGSGNAAELTTGTVPDERLSVNIARLADLSSLSNLLTAQLEELSAALNTLSNQVKALTPAEGTSGVTAVSADPADATLLGLGWIPFYNVPAPGWIGGTAAEAPSARFGHSAVWTGDRLIVWGGSVGGGVLSAMGAAYDPAVDQWSSISPLDAPVGRQGHSAVWTGEALLIWGGFGSGGFGAGSYLGTGGSYSPSTGNWNGLPAENAPAERDGQASAWTGARLVVWGGKNAGGLLADGALYDPTGGQWSALPTAGAPEARFGAVGVWTGTFFVVWGGTGELGPLSTGARLPLAGGTTAGAWSPLPGGTEAPGARSGHTAVWTGEKVLIWGGQQGGGFLGDGAAYDPANDTWELLPDSGAPSARSGHVAVWTGEEMLIFGGETASGVVATGGAFNPTTGQWRALSSAGNPVPRHHATGVWSGSELLVFGGQQSSGSPVAALQRLNPQPTWYFYRKP